MPRSELETRELLNAIVAAADAERHLLSQLRAALRRQRDGVAVNDAAGIEAASRAVSNAVLTIDLARRRREDLLALVSPGVPVKLDSLEQLLGPEPALAAAREELYDEALGVMRELAVTQSVLQGAMQAGTNYLQALFTSVTEVAPLYGDPTQRTVSSTAGGTLVNRSA